MANSNYEQARETRFQAVANYNAHVQSCATCTASEEDDSQNAPLCKVGELALHTMFLTDAAVDREAARQEDAAQAAWERDSKKFDLVVIR